MRLGIQQVTVERTSLSGPDEFGNTSDLTVATFIVDGCSVQPAGGSELISNRDQVTTELVAFLPPTPRVEDYDRIVYGGVTYELDGPVGRWEVGTPLDHQELKLRRANG